MLKILVLILCWGFLGFSIFKRTRLYFKLRVYMTLYYTVFKFRLKGSNMKVKSITFYEKEEK